MTQTLAVALDGVTLLPAGHAGTIKSYLEMTAPPADRTVPAAPAGFALRRLTGADEPLYHAIFRTLGTRWLWWSRLMLTSETRQVILDHPEVHAFAVMETGTPCGLIELDFRAPLAPDLAFLGLYDGHTGHGRGNWLMGEALRRLWAGTPERVTVNTCTFDHPGALAFYRRHGFKIIRQAVEIVPDPRLSGLLPRDAAPHVPIVET